ncbi:MAG: hypothetical protein IJO88_02870 [Oscillospiraceae bacterium]|nr:hypothetical protein [Oscillospiraceae bacterium]
MEESVTRDMEGQVRALYAEHPELKGEALPEEVVTACAVEGRELKDAYEAYNAAREEKKKPAAYAPVRSVTRGGAVEAKPGDAFLKGFDAAW